MLSDRHHLSRSLSKRTSLDILFGLILKTDTETDHFWDPLTPIRFPQNARKDDIALVNSTLS